MRSLGQKLMGGVIAFAGIRKVSNSIAQNETQQ
jgi:hypothetical protein